MTEVDNWRELGQQLRVDSIRARDAPNSGHPTSSMSAADLMAVLLAKYLRYDFDAPENPSNDHLIFSKGHASPLLYSMYKAAGAINDEELLTFRKLGSRLEGHPTPGPAVGRRRHRLARPGPADRRRRRARRQAPRPAAVPRLGPVRRQRDGRGLDVGGVRAGGLRRARQPDRDHRRQPARPARPDDARLGPRRLRAPAEAFGWHAIEIDGHDVDADRPRVRRGASRPTAADRDRRADAQGQGRRRGREQGTAARQAARRPGRGDRRARAAIRDITVDVRQAASGRSAAPVRRPGRSSCRATSSAARRSHAQGLRRRARARSAPRAATSSPSTARSATRPTPSSFATRTPSASSRCTSPSSRWSRPRSACRCAAGTPFASTFAAFLARAYDFIRMAADQPGEHPPVPARTPASRSARTARRRWGSRTSRCCAPSTAAPCSTRATPTRPPSSWR